MQEALLLIGVCLFLVFFAWLRSRVQSWLTRAVFRQGSLASLASRVKEGPAFTGEEQYLDWAAALIAAAVGTADYAVVGQTEAQASWAEASVPIEIRIPLPATAPSLASRRRRTPRSGRRWRPAARCASG
jgi:hypothetical protein